MMKTIRTRSVAALALFLTLCAAAHAEPLKAILLTSPGVYHDYNYQSRAITAALAARMSVRVDVSLAEKARWKTTDFGSGYDVIIYNICMADDTDAALIENMRRQTETLGIPALVLHCTMHSFRKTDLWWPLYGLQSVEHESIGEVPLQRVDGHPLSRALPQNWTLRNDELYVNLAFAAQPLLTARGADGNTHVTAWTHTINGTRIFGTTLGHSRETIEDPAYQQLLANGLLWATNNLAENGQPRAGLAPDPATTAPGTISRAEGVDFLDDDARSCMQREIVWAIGPCYAGCIINPLIWGAEANACKAACIAAIPASEILIASCEDA